MNHRQSLSLMKALVQKILFFLNVYLIEKCFYYEDLLKLTLERSINQFKLEIINHDCDFFYIKVCQSKEHIVITPNFLLDKKIMNFVILIKNSSCNK